MGEALQGRSSGQGLRGSRRLPVILAVLVLLLGGAAIVWWLTDGAPTRVVVQRPVAEALTTPSNPPLTTPAQPEVPAPQPTPATETTVESTPTPSDQSPMPDDGGPLLSTDGELIDDHLIYKEPPFNVTISNNTPFSVKLTGKVMSVGGKPLPGAVVTGVQMLTHSPIRPEPDGREGNVLRAHWSWLVSDGGRAVTGEDGSFEIMVSGMGPAPRLLGAGPQVRVEAKLEGWAMIQAPQPVWPDDKRDSVVNVEIVMTKHGSIRGIAVDAITGEKLPGAVIGATRQGGLATTYAPVPTHSRGSYMEPAEPGPRIVAAGEDGTFELVGAGEGHWLVYGLPPGISPSKYRGLTGTLPREAEGAGKVELPSGGQVEGVVVRVPRMAGVVFRTNPTDLIRVRAVLERVPTSHGYESKDVYSRLSRGTGRALTAREDGSYLVQGLLASHVSMVVGTSGFVPVVVELPQFTGDEVDVGVLSFQAGAQIEVLVLEGSGKPAAGAYLAVAAIGSSGGASGIDFAGSGGSRTSADGRYSIKGLTAGKYEVRVTHAGHGRSSTIVEVPADGKLETTIQLEFAATVRGRIIPPKNAPSPVVMRQQKTTPYSNVEVRVSSTKDIRSDGTHTFVKHGSRHLNMMPESGRPNVPVMEDWTFEAQGLTPGTYLFGVQVGGAALMVEGVAEVGRINEVVIDLSGVGTVKGHVKDEEGKVLAGAVVSLFKKGQTSFFPGHGRPQAVASANTDAAGFYEFTELAAGEFELRVEGYLHFHPPMDSDKSMVANVEAGTVVVIDIDFSTKRGVELAARWTYQGQPAFSQLSINPKDGAVMTGVSRSHGLFKDADGWFRAVGFGSGTYELTVMGLLPGSTLSHNYRVTMVIPEGTKKHVIDEVLPPGSLRGTISSTMTNADLSAVAMVFNPLGPDGQLVDAGWPLSVTLPGGAYTIDALIARKYRVTLTAANHLSITRDVDVALGTVYDFVLGEPAGSVLLKPARLVDSQGNAVTPAQPAQTVWLHVFDRSGKPITPRSTGGFGRQNQYGTPNVDAMIDALPVGDVRVVLTSSHYQTWQREIRIVAGETVKIDVMLVQAPRLVLRIPAVGLDREQRKAIAYTITWQGASGLPGGAAWPVTGVAAIDGKLSSSATFGALDADGRASTYPTAIGVAGRVEVTVTRPGYQPYAATLTLTGNQLTVHDVEMVPISTDSPATPGDGPRGSNPSELKTGAAKEK